VTRPALKARRSRSKGFGDAFPQAKGGWIFRQEKSSPLSESMINAKYFIHDK